MVWSALRFATLRSGRVEKHNLVIWIILAKVWVAVEARWYFEKVSGKEACDRSPTQQAIHFGNY